MVAVTFPVYQSPFPVVPFNVISGASGFSLSNLYLSVVCGDCLSSPSSNHTSIGMSVPSIAVEKVFSPSGQVRTSPPFIVYFICTAPDVSVGTLLVTVTCTAAIYQPSLPVGVLNSIVGASNSPKGCYI